MSASSSSSSTAPIHHDVFISFRGTDIRNNFLSHLVDALREAKVQTYIDNRLNRGEDVSCALLKAIAESKISIIIFSKNYGSSSWCLDELVQIMKCKNENGQIVIPVFYKVDPSHVRKQSGRFGQALARFEGHSKIQNWRDALTKAANISGRDSQVERPEAELIKSIVRDILGKLYLTPSNNFGNLVGMTSRIKQIESLLCMIKKDVRIIGLWGMGGIGKTTLATEFFNRFLFQFERHHFIEDIGENCETRRLNELREKLITGILKDENLNVGTPNLGIPFIRDRLRRTKVLIVLDGVHDFRQIELLVGQCDCFGPRSIIIITSTDKQVLEGRVDWIYEVQRLDFNESRRLFSQYAFQQELPTYGYHELSTSAINYTQGHPLALKILGSHLRGRSKQEQESALRKLERTLDKDVQQVLLVSYNGLDDEEKDIFLSIASSSFEGESVEDFKYITNASDIGIRVLIDKCLINIQTGRVQMHDLLRKMGQKIIREKSIDEPGKRNWLWDQGDISHVLTKGTGTDAVKGILLDRGTSLSINPTAFESMPNLVYLNIRGFSSPVSLPHGLKSLSDKLRYMCWKQYPLTYLPSNFHPENLVKLIMRESHVERLWQGRQNLKHLKEIDLSSSKKLIEIPDLSLVTNLQILDLSDCQRLERLENLGIRNISKLRRLYLNGCSHIKKFPEVPLNIEDLDLMGTGIEEVPSIYNLKSLKCLDLRGCPRLKNLSTSIYKLDSYNYYLWRHLDSTFLADSKRKHQDEVNAHLRNTIDKDFRFIPYHLPSGAHLIEGLPSCLGLQKMLFPKPHNARERLKEYYLRNSNKLFPPPVPQLPMNVQRSRNCCKSLETVVSALSVAARGIYVANTRFMLCFVNCFKLGHNATFPETFSQNPRTIAACMTFQGGGVPHWFNYKSRESSLTKNLPPHWCDSKLSCLVFSIVIEYGNIDFLNFDCHIRKKRGDSSIVSSDFHFTWKIGHAMQPNQVFLMFDQAVINDWRMIPQEADEVDEISIEFYVEEFYVEEDGRNYYSINECGVHLLYDHDMNWF